MKTILVSALSKNGCRPRCGSPTICGTIEIVEQPQELEQRKDQQYWHVLQKETDVAQDVEQPQSVEQPRTVQEPKFVEQPKDMEQATRCGTTTICGTTTNCGTNMICGRAQRCGTGDKRQNKERSAMLKLL